MNNLDKEVDNFSKKVKNREKDYNALTSLEKEFREEERRVRKRNDMYYCLIVLILFVAYIISLFLIPTS